MRILLIDDDELFTSLLKANITEQRYTVDTAANGQEGWDFVEAQNYDLIVLDVMLPKLDGISFCRRLRAKGLQTLVLLLTARGTSDDKVMGLDAGADDYLVKPVPLPEIEARIRALLRRKATTVSPVLEWGNLRFDPSVGTVTYGEVLLNLTPKEYALLELFMRNTQKIHSQSSILNQLWSLSDEPASGDTIRALIKRLRQKLKAVGASDLIETVYGLGYRLNSALQKTLLTDVTSSLPSKARNQSISTNFWEESKSKILEQIAILEQATQKLLQNPLQDNSQKTAKQVAHKLIGSLSILGLPQGAEIVQKIERLLQAQVSFEPEQLQFLCEQVQVLRQRIECTTPQKLEKQATNEGITATKQIQIEQQTRLLIVDEDREFINTLVVEATTWGMQTAIVANPQQALEAIGRVRPDIVLLDMSVPNTRKDGLIFLEELSKQTPPIAVLVLTTNTQVTDQVAMSFDKPFSLERGIPNRSAVLPLCVYTRQVRGFLEKPIVPKILLETITQILKKAKVVEAKVMLLDDDRLTLRFLQTLLEPWGLQVTTLSNPLQFWDELEAVTPDLLILDVQMPDIDGIELCRTLRNDSRWAWLPILFLTGQRDAETIQNLFAAGADDYVSKPVVVSELVTRIFNRLERTRLLREYAQTDSLTGLPNRQRSQQDLERLLHLASQYQQPFCLAVLTLDHLTQVNRNYGHRLGDQIIRRLAHLLRRELRDEDIVSRWDGAEFIVGMYGIKRGDGVEWLAEILELLRQIEFTTCNSKIIHSTFSAGVTQYPEDGINIQTLYQTAGAILEKAIECGGNRVLPANWQPLRSHDCRQSPSHPSPVIDVILIHQDSPFANSIMGALEMRGYHSYWLKDGKTALEVLAGNTPSLHGRVLLLEENLPLLNGLEIVKRFKRDKITQRSKVVWLSENLSQVENVLNLGCFDYINVPCKISAFMYRLRQVLLS